VRVVQLTITRNVERGYLAAYEKTSVLASLCSKCVYVNFSSRLTEDTIVDTAAETNEEIAL